MPNPDALLKSLEKKMRELSLRNADYRDLMLSKAKAQEDYSVSYAKKMFELKGGGQSITLIPKLSEGDKHVAELKFKLDVAEALVRANLQSQKNIHAVMDGIRSELAWLKAEMGQG